MSAVSSDDGSWCLHTVLGYLFLSKQHLACRQWLLVLLFLESMVEVSLLDDGC